VLYIEKKINDQSGIFFGKSHKDLIDPLKNPFLSGSVNLELNSGMPNNPEPISTLSQENLNKR